MGNCSQKSSTNSANKAPDFIRIMTDSGRVMDLQGPKLAREFLDEFPGYGIYQRGQLSLPLFEDEVLCNGQIYYLLPFGVSNTCNRVHTPSFDGCSSFRKYQSSAFEVLPSRGNGIWRVKMAINSKELEEMMMSENAGALIEMMRSAAKSSEISPSPTRRIGGFGWKSMAVISSGFKFPAVSRRLTAC